MYYDEPGQPVAHTCGACLLIAPHQHLHHVPIPYEIILPVAPEAIRLGTLMVAPAHSYERAAPCAPPIHGTRFAFRDAVKHKSQANSGHHVVVFVVDDIEGHTKQPAFQALCCEIALPGTELKEVVQSTWVQNCPEGPAPHAYGKDPFKYNYKSCYMNIGDK